VTCIESACQGRPGGAATRGTTAMTRNGFNEALGCSRRSRVKTINAGPFGNHVERRERGRTLGGGVSKVRPVALRQISRVQDRYNFSVPNVLFSNLGLPTVPQNQRDRLTLLALGARGPRFKSGRPDQTSFGCRLRRAAKQAGSIPVVE